MITSRLIDRVGCSNGYINSGFPLIPISEDRKIIYIRIPRCAGTSMKRYFAKKNMYGRIGKKKFMVRGKFLDFYCDDEINNLLNIERLGSIWDDSFKFSIVRNPIERFISGFYYCKNGQRESCLRHIPINFFATNIDNRVFTKRLSKTVKRHILRRQIDHCIEECDLIMKLENIRREFVIFKKVSGETVGRLPKLNGTKRPRVELPPQAENALKKYFEIDFQQLGYI